MAMAVRHCLIPTNSKCMLCVVVQTALSSQPGTRPGLGHHPPFLQERQDCPCLCLATLRHTHPGSLTFVCAAPSQQAGDSAAKTISITKPSISITKSAVAAPAPAPAPAPEPAPAAKSVNIAVSKPSLPQVSFVKTADAVNKAVSVSKSVQSAPAQPLISISKTAAPVQAYAGASMSFSKSVEVRCSATDSLLQLWSVLLWWV